MTLSRNALRLGATGSLLVLLTATTGTAVAEPTDGFLAQPPTAETAGVAVPSATLWPIAPLLESMLLGPATATPPLRASDGAVISDGADGAGGAGADADGAPEPAPRPKPPLPDDVLMPLDSYWISCRYGCKGPSHPNPHSGMDFAADSGEPIHAIRPGTVVQSGWNGGGGNTVSIRRWDGKVIKYMHMSRRAAAVGDWVSPGEVIGYVGSTGHSTGPHLHLQVNLPGGGTMDPADWIGMSYDDIKAWGRE
jgi:murein DD-endopeptidase MepM/ murein hydrolase activator NlpD